MSSLSVFKVKLASLFTATKRGGVDWLGPIVLLPEVLSWCSGALQVFIIELRAPFFEVLVHSSPGAGLFLGRTPGGLKQ